MDLQNDLQAMNESVNIQFGGTKPPLSVDNLATIVVNKPDLFANLNVDCHPSVTKFKKYSEEDRNFLMNK